MSATPPTTFVELCRFSFGFPKLCFWLSFCLLFQYSTCIWFESLCFHILFFSGAKTSVDWLQSFLFYIYFSLFFYIIFFITVLFNPTSSYLWLSQGTEVNKKSTSYTSVVSPQKKKKKKKKKKKEKKNKEGVWGQTKTSVKVTLYTCRISVTFTWEITFVTSYLFYWTSGPSLKGVYSKRKEFAPMGSKFFPFSVDTC